MCLEKSPIPEDAGTESFKDFSTSFGSGALHIRGCIRRESQPISTHVKFGVGSRQLLQHAGLQQPKVLACRSANYLFYSQVSAFHGSGHGGELLTKVSASRIQRTDSSRTSKLQKKSFFNFFLFQLNRWLMSFAIHSAATILVKRSRYSLDT